MDTDIVHLASMACDEMEFNINEAIALLKSLNLRRNNRHVFECPNVLMADMDAAIRFLDRVRKIKLDTHWPNAAEYSDGYGWQHCLYEDE